MSKSKKWFLFLCSFCFAAALTLGTGIACFAAEGQTSDTQTDGTQSEETTVAKEDVKSFAIIDTLDTYSIPVSIEGAPSSLWQTVVQEGGFTIQAEYTLNDGSNVTVDVTKDEIKDADIDYTVPGTHEITITDDISGLSDTVEVEVFEYTVVGKWDTIGINGYDVNDSRNEPGTWNGHMIIGMNSYSKNTINMTGGTSGDILDVMASYITYERADGTTYHNTKDDKCIAVWELSANILVMITPNGYSQSTGYGMHQVTNKEFPIYNEGDKITFAKGMPIYLYICNKDQSEGYYVKEGYLGQDYTYYCYSDNGTSSLWQLYAQYTDFTVRDTVELDVNSTAQVGATRVPTDATTGTFSYSSSDTSVVTVSETGNLIGIKVGTATITVTLTGGLDADGNPLDPIVKTLTVNVTRGVQSVSGEGKIKVGGTFDPANYKLTITYTDGTKQEVALNDPSVMMQEVDDTSVAGEQRFNVSVTVDGETVRGVFTLNVTNGGCGSALEGAALWGGAAVLLLSAAVIIFRKRIGNR